MDSLDSDENAHLWFIAKIGGDRNLFFVKFKKVKIYDMIMKFMKVDISFVELAVIGRNLHW